MAKQLDGPHLKSLKDGKNAKDKDGNVINEPFYKVLTDLASFYEKHRGKIVIANLFQLAAGADKVYSMDFKKLIREGVKVEAEYLVKVNESYWNTGKFYEVDENATEANRKERVELVDKRAKFAANKTKVADALIESAAGVKNAPAPKASKITVLYGVDSNSEIFSDIDETHKDDYAFTGTREECIAYIDEQDNHEGSPEIWTVGKPAKNGLMKLSQFDGEESEIVREDYSFVGTEEECKAFRAEAYKNKK